MNCSTSVKRTSEHRFGWLTYASGSAMTFSRPCSFFCSAKRSSGCCSCGHLPSCVLSCDHHSYAHRSCVRRIRTATAFYHHFLNCWTFWLQPLESSVLQGFVARIARFAHNSDIVVVSVAVGVSQFPSERVSPCDSIHR